MKFSLIVCTYMRPQALVTLLDSVKEQLCYPDEIIIVDGSKNDQTKERLTQSTYTNLQYYTVTDQDRGLTKQRNIGIAKVGKDIDIVCFLDDDIVLTDSYFQNILKTYQNYPKAGGVGGYIIEESVSWRKLKENEQVADNEYEIDGYARTLGSRNVLRKKLGLLSNVPPCYMPTFSNGFSVSSLPPNDKTFPAEYFMGGVSSFRKKVVDTIKFSTYFAGYGLYEDLEYCLRVSKKYPLYVNTEAKLYHYHEEGGRPNKYSYGKMVVRNGWYVWRTKYPNPPFVGRLKWNLIMLVLMLLRFINIFTTPNKKEAFTEFLGRKIGWLSLLINKPKKAKV